MLKSPCEGFLVAYVAIFGNTQLHMFIYNLHSLRIAQNQYKNWPCSSSFKNLLLLARTLSHLSTVSSPSFAPFFVFLLNPHHHSHLPPQSPSSCSSSSSITILLIILNHHHQFTSILLSPSPFSSSYCIITFLIFLLSIL